MSLAYGYDLNDGDDFMTAPVQASELVSRVALPGAVLVNHLPFCAALRFITLTWVSHRFLSVRRIHSWVPFLNYEPLIRRGKELSEKIKDEPFDFVKNAMVSHDCSPTVYLDRYRYSIMAQPFSHWQERIYWSWRVLLGLNVRNRRRSSKRPWVHYMEVKNYIMDLIHPSYKFTFQPVQIP